MTATNHALTGAVIALAVHNPWIAIPTAFITHFVMDAIPHYDAGPDHPSLYKKSVSIDISLAAVVTILLSIWLKAPVSGWLIFACAAACMSPDWVWGWRYLKTRDFKKVVYGPMLPITRYHLKIQWSESHVGILVELAWAALMAVLIHNLAK